MTAGCSSHPSPCPRTETLATGGAVPPGSTAQALCKTSTASSASLALAGDVSAAERGSSYLGTCQGAPAAWTLGQVVQVSGTSSLDFPRTLVAPLQSCTSSSSSETGND